MKIPEGKFIWARERRDGEFKPQWRSLVLTQTDGREQPYALYVDAGYDWKILFFSNSLIGVGMFLSRQTHDPNLYTEVISCG